MGERLIYIQERENNELDVTYVGLSREQQKRIKTHAECIGFPLGNVHELVYTEGKEGQENVLGSYEPFDGKLTLYKSLDNLPPIAQHGTIVHELAHSVSPFDPKSEKLYQTNAALEQAKTHASAVAEQSKITGVYLNGYQAKLHEQLEAGEIDNSRFVEETRAIMMELRFTNPKH